MLCYNNDNQLGHHATIQHRPGMLVSQRQYSRGDYECTTCESRMRHGTSIKSSGIHERQDLSRW